MKYGIIELVKKETERIPLDRELVDKTKSVLKIGRFPSGKSIQVAILKKGVNEFGPLYWRRLKNSRWLARLEERGEVKIIEKEDFFGQPESALKKYFADIHEVSELNKYLPYCANEKFKKAQNIIAARIKTLANRPKKKGVELGSTSESNNPDQS